MKTLGKRVSVVCSGKWEQLGQEAGYSHKRLDRGQVSWRWFSQAGALVGQWDQANDHGWIWLDVNHPAHWA